MHCDRRTHRALPALSASSYSVRSGPGARRARGSDDPTSRCPDGRVVPIALAMSFAAPQAAFAGEAVWLTTDGKMSHTAGHADAKVVVSFPSRRTTSEAGSRTSAPATATAPTSTWSAPSPARRVGRTPTADAWARTPTGAATAGRTSTRDPSSTAPDWARCAYSSASGTPARAVRRAAPGSRSATGATTSRIRSASNLCPQGPAAKFRLGIFGFRA